jgi:hypothetical protein
MPPPPSKTVELPSANAAAVGISDLLAVRRTVLSPCRLYRYTLWREWSDDLFVNRTNYAMFIGLNPSTADETLDDPTIRKCVGFAKRWGYLALCMTNLFAFRATHPRKMKCQSKPIGDQNDRWLSACARDAGIIVAAWGVNGEHMGRDEEVLKLIDRVESLRTTKAGFPEHPLYVPYETLTKPYGGRTANEKVSEVAEQPERHKMQSASP